MHVQPTTVLLYLVSVYDAFCVSSGPELIAHEVTVPSITTVLLSAACFAVAEATRLAAKCSETVAAAIDGAYMVSLATVVVVVRLQPLLVFDKLKSKK
jgi:hypothetical protein